MISEICEQTTIQTYRQAYEIDTSGGELIRLLLVCCMSDREKGMNTFTLRPMCSEAGSVGHLVTAFLTSESVVHNFVLSKVP